MGTSSIGAAIAHLDLRHHRDERATMQPIDDPSYTRGMSKEISVPFSQLVLYHREIGIHRGRKAGFREIFDFYTLHDLLFTKLAGKVKDAYEGRHVPSHRGWSDQREALRWFVEQGRDAIYALDTKPIGLRPCHYGRYYISEGNHRALALYILGESEIQAKLQR
jgi:hypothetical protein